MTVTVLQNERFPDWITDPGQDTRNVIDRFKGVSDDDIRQALSDEAFPLVVVLENFAHDFNIGTAVRNANAFGASRVHVLGRGQWDRRGAVGTHHYTPVSRQRSVEDLYAGYRADGYRIVAVDNVPGAVSLREHVWEAKTVLVFGQEDIGVSNVTLREADGAVMVDQFGSVRSLNVGTASGIVMHAYAGAVAG